MKVLVIGGTGTVGSVVVQELLGRGVEVQVLTRSAARAARLPAGVEGLVGDLLDPATIRTAFREAEGVFLLNAVSTTETHEGLLAVNGARMAGVERIVYLSVHNADGALHLPHFGSKLPIEAALKASGIPYTILRPSNFFQGDRAFEEVMLRHGVYPQPLGSRGISRVDVRDIAEAAAVALTTRGHEGETYNLVGPEALTGARVAEIWSEVLGRHITYAGDDLDAWEEGVLAFLPGWMAFDFRLMYAVYQEQGVLATRADLDRLTRLLGRPPRRFEAFAAETAEAWMARV